jgi:hypothetical protein
MKFVFEIKTEPTFHAAVVIAVVVTSSSALATIAVSLANPSIANYLVTILALIISGLRSQRHLPKIMDPNAARPLALARETPPAGPRILQLSPLPGKTYNMDRYNYDPAANVSQGNFAAVLVFASVHGHPVVVHECPDIYLFQAAHPSTIVRSLNKVPPAILA